MDGPTFTNERLRWLSTYGVDEPGHGPVDNINLIRQLAKAWLSDRDAHATKTKPLGARFPGDVEPRGLRDGRIVWTSLPDPRGLYDSTCPTCGRDIRTLSSVNPGAHKQCYSCAFAEAERDDRGPKP